MIDSWRQLSAILTANAFTKGVPLTGQFELTPRCNLSCQMCYICKNAGDKSVIKQELKAKDWIKLGESALQAGTLFLQLTGGEIFIKDDFKEIYEAFVRMGFNISLNTNGTMITPKVADWIGKNPPSQIDLTLYGASRETYAKVCGDPDGFDRTIRGITLLLEQGINLQLRTTIIQSNVDDYEQMLEIAKGFGLDLDIVNYVSPRRDDDLQSPQEIRLSPKDLAAFERKVFGVKITHSNEQKSALEVMDGFDLSKVEIASALSEDAAFPCTAGKITYWITWDGRMIPCPSMNQPVTYPLEEGLVNAWNRLKTLCNTIPACSECKACSYKDDCYTCAANLYGETGFYDKPAQYLCELARERAYAHKA